MASIKEQRAKLQQKIAALQAKEKALAQKDKAAERKERTRRLIKVGALIEKYAGEISSLEAFEKYLKQYGSYIKKNQSTDFETHQEK